jgi:spermidine synthase
VPIEERPRSHGVRLHADDDGGALSQSVPEAILIIGLGGGTLPGALQKLLPAAKLDVVEIDPAVVRVAGKYFGFVPGPRTDVFEEDGRVFAKRMARQGIRYDLVMLDAFDHEYIPEHMLTREFLQEIKALLSPDGVLAANTFATSKLYDFESATYFSVFGPFYRLKRGNRVILVRQGGLPEREELSRNADALEARLAPLGCRQGVAAADARSRIRLGRATPAF